MCGINIVNLVKVLVVTHMKFSKKKTSNSTPFEFCCSFFLPKHQNKLKTSSSIQTKINKTNLNSSTCILYTRKKKDWEKSLCFSIHQTIFNPQKRWNLFRRQNEWTAFPGRTKNGWINLQQKKNQQGQRLNCSFCFTFDKIQIINEKYSLTLRNWIGVNKWSSQSVFFFSIRQKWHHYSTKQNDFVYILTILWYRL